MKTARPSYFVFLTVMLVTLYGCARNEVILSLAVSDPRVATVEQIHVATLRAPSQNNFAVYSGDRSQHLNFAQVAVSVPKQREAGTITYPRKVPNLETQFARSVIQPTRAKSSS